MGSEGNSSYQLVTICPFPRFTKKERAKLGKLRWDRGDLWLPKEVTFVDVTGQIVSQHFSYLTERWSWQEETICNICGCHRPNCISTFLLSHRTMRVDQNRRFADFVQVFTVNKKATCSIVHIDCLRKTTKLLLGWKKLISLGNLGSCSIVYLFWTDKLYHPCNASREFKVAE